MTGNFIDRLTGVDTQTARPIPLDDALHLLSSARRRAIVRVLLEDYDGESTVRELAEHLAALELGLDPGADVEHAAYKRVYVSIYQSHLPALVEAGAVGYDPENGDPARVTATGTTRTLAAVLDRVADVPGVTH